MIARRLLIVLLVMLVASTVAALLAPAPQPPDSTSTGTRTTTTDGQAGRDKRQGQGRAQRGEARPRLVRARITGDEPLPATVRARVGDQLSLEVRWHRPDQVALRGFGLLADVGPFDPATFDVLAERPGTFDVRLLEARRTLGRVVVSSAARR